MYTFHRLCRETMVPKPEQKASVKYLYKDKNSFSGCLGRRKRKRRRKRNRKSRWRKKRGRTRK